MAKSPVLITEAIFEGCKNNILICKKYVTHRSREPHTDLFTRLVGCIKQLPGHRLRSFLNNPSLSHLL